MIQLTKSDTCLSSTGAAAAGNLSALLTREDFADRRDEGMEMQRMTGIGMMDGRMDGGMVEDCKRQ